MGDGESRYSGCFRRGVEVGQRLTARVSMKGEARCEASASSMMFFLLERVRILCGVVLCG